MTWNKSTYVLISPIEGRGGGVDLGVLVVECEVFKEETSAKVVLTRRPT